MPIRGMNFFYYILDDQDKRIEWRIYPSFERKHIVKVASIHFATVSALSCFYLDHLFVDIFTEKKVPYET
jgi:hypothetical protein